MTGIRLLIVADDFTGGLDTGVQFARQGIGARVVMDGEAALGDAPDCQVLVAVAETRHLPPSEAYAAVYRLVRAAGQAGIPYIYKKTDSALRGNIGAELSAALDASGAEALPFLPAFPRMGRTTADGRHYIEGVPVAESVFGRDPFNPVRESDVCRLIAAQTDTPTWRAKPDDIPAGRGICVVDAASDEDLMAAGRRLAAMGALRVSAGCAGFAAALPRLLGLRESAPPALPALGDGLLVLCGSVNPITRRQLERAERAGYRRIRLSPAQKLEEGWLETERGRALREELREAARAERWLIIDANDPEEDCAETLAYAGARGWDLEEVRRRITGALGAILKELQPEWTGTLLITGGDTLRQCLERLGTRQLEPMLELFPGVALSGFQIRGETRLVVTKSGGFGEETLLLRMKQLIEGQRDERGGEFCGKDA